MKLLFVEDEHNMMPTLKRHLEREGFELCFAATASAAIQDLGKDRFDIVLLDIMIPTGLSGNDHDLGKTSWPGLDILRRIRSGEFAESGNTDSLPVVVLTALGMDYQLAEIWEHKPTVLLQKPKRINDIVRHVREAATARGGAETHAR